MQINAQSMAEGKNYRLTVDVASPSSETRVAHEEFQINRVPYGGKCDVTPKTGQSIASVGTCTVLFGMNNISNA